MKTLLVPEFTPTAMHEVVVAQLMAVRASDVTTIGAVHDDPVKVITWPPTSTALQRVDVGQLTPEIE